MKFELETFKNLLEPGVNSRVLEVQGDDRKELYNFMEGFEMPRSTSYNRMVRNGYGSGFEEWELMGVNNVIRCFCEEYGLRVPAEKSMKKFYLEKLDGLKEQFYAYLYQKGMSRSTVLYRFRNWNFKKWEQVGIRSVIGKLCGEEAA